MRRFLLGLALVATGSVLTACGGDSTSPTRDARPGARGDIIGPDRAQVTSDLNAIYPTGGVGTAANAQLTNVFKSLDGGKLVAARQEAAALCEFTKKQQAAGRLHAPTDQVTTLDAAVSSLCTEIFLSVGLAPSGIDVSGQDAVAQFIPACSPAEVRLPNGRALVRWSAKDEPTNTTCTYNQDVTVVITPIDYLGFDPGKGPLGTTENQWPFFYDITVVPLIQPNNPVTIGICTLDDGSTYSPPETVHDNLRIGHNRSASAPGGPGFEVLPVVTLTHTDLACIPASSAFQFREDLRDRGVMFALGGAARALSRGAIDAVTPTAAYAGHGGLGGLASSFSPFGAVEVTPAPLPISSNYALDPAALTFPGPATQLNVVNVPISFVPPTCTPVPGTWSSSNTAVGTVSSTGVLTPLSLGSTDVSAECTGLGVRVLTNILVTSPIL